MSSESQPNDVGPSSGQPRQSTKHGTCETVGAHSVQEFVCHSTEGYAVRSRGAPQTTSNKTWRELPAAELLEIVRSEDDKLSSEELSFLFEIVTRRLVRSGNLFEPETGRLIEVLEGIRQRLPKQ